MLDIIPPFNFIPHLGFLKYLCLTVQAGGFEFTVFLSLTMQYFDDSQAKPYTVGFGYLQPLILSTFALFQNTIAIHV